MKKTNLLTTLLSCVVTATFLASPAQATSVILADNTSNLTAWNTGVNSSFATNNAAYTRLNGMTFVTGSTSYNLTSISVAMRYNLSGSISPTMRVYAFENSSTAATKPVSLATPVFQEDFTGDAFDSTQEIHTFSPTATWNLKPNTSYSFALGTDFTAYPAFLHWMYAASPGTTTSNVGFTAASSVFYSLDGGSSYSTAPGGYSMQITGVAAVPEPSGFLATSLLLGAAGLIRRRQAKAA
jgi:hypothetical protein